MTYISFEFRPQYNTNIQPVFRIWLNNPILKIRNRKGEKNCPLSKYLSYGGCMVIDLCFRYPNIRIPASIHLNLYELFLKIRILFQSEAGGWTSKNWELK